MVSHCPNAMTRSGALRSVDLRKRKELYEWQQAGKRNLQSPEGHLKCRITLHTRMLEKLCAIVYVSKHAADQATPALVDCHWLVISAHCRYRRRILEQSLRQHTRALSSTACPQDSVACNMSVLWQAVLLGLVLVVWKAVASVPNLVAWVQLERLPHAPRKLLLGNMVPGAMRLAQPHLTWFKMHKELGGLFCIRLAWRHVRQSCAAQPSMLCTLWYLLVSDWMHCMMLFIHALNKVFPKVLLNVVSASRHWP